MNTTLFSRARRMRNALRLIGVSYCGNYTTGPGSCLDTKRTKNAEFTADRWCDQCIAFWGLRLKRPSSGASQGSE